MIDAPGLELLAQEIEGRHDGAIVATYVASTQPTEIVRLDPAAGTHTLTMRFEPLSWHVGLTISTLTWLALALWGALRLYRRRGAFNRG